MIANNTVSNGTELTSERKFSQNFISESTNSLWNGFGLISEMTDDFMRYAFEINGTFHTPLKNKKKYYPLDKTKSEKYYH